MISILERSKINFKVGEKVPMDSLYPGMIYSHDRPDQIHNYFYQDGHRYKICVIANNKKGIGVIGVGENSVNAYHSSLPCAIYFVGYESITPEEIELGRRHLYIYEEQR